MPEKLLSPPEVAELLGVDTVKARELMRSMRCINVGRSQANPRWRVTPSEIDRWQRQAAQVPTTQMVVLPDKRSKKLPRTWLNDSDLFDAEGRIKRRCSGAKAAVR